MVNWFRSRKALQRKLQDAMDEGAFHAQDAAQLKASLISMQRQRDDWKGVAFKFGNQIAELQPIIRLGQSRRRAVEKQNAKEKAARAKAVA